MFHCCLIVIEVSVLDRTPTVFSLSALSVHKHLFKLLEIYVEKEL